MGRVHAECGVRATGTRPPAQVAAIVAAYTAVFCLALPAALWWIGSTVHPLLGLDLAPSPLGAVVAAPGALLLPGGMAALWRRGRGWPIGALPPPVLVREGPYRWVRHPIYLGFNLLLAGGGWMAGNAGVALVVASLLAPAWIAYALAEERGLERRFGSAYRRYRERVGLLPRPSLRPVMWLLRTLRVLRVRVLSGAEHLPGQGPVVLVGNHTCYSDPVWLSLAVPRRVWMVATAEAYRRRSWIRFATRWMPTVPVRRYRVDPSAARRVVDLLGAGEAVCMFGERERSVLGGYLGAEPRAAAILPRLGVPVVPFAILDAYATGPRWAGTLRFPTVHLRFGPPIAWGEGTAHAQVDAAVRALFDEDPQRVHLEREPLHRLRVAVWRCPRCLDEAGWRPEVLACLACGARWTPSGDGWVRDEGGRDQALATWAAPAWRAPEHGPLRVVATLLDEEDPHGPIGPLRDRGEVTVEVGAAGVAWEGHRIPIEDILSTSTERADTLQIGTADAMWQLVLRDASPFRLRNLLDRHRAETPPRPGVAVPFHPEAPPRRWPTGGLAVGLGLAVVEGLAVLVPLSAGHGAAGLAGVLPMALLYVGVGAAVDAACAALGARNLVAGSAMGLLALGAGMIGLVPGPVLGVSVGLAALWAALAHRRSLRIFAAALALWGLSPVLPRPAPGPAALADAQAPPGARSVVVVVLDTVRADATSLERNDRDTTPHLAALAARGTRFSRAYSTSCWTLPAHASLLTGRLPREHGAHYEHLALPSGVPTVAEALAARGWETAAFSANPLFAPGTGLGRGFTRFEERWRPWLLRDSLLGWRAWNRLAAPSRDKGGMALVAAVEGWWRERDRRRPFLAVVNVMEAHAPYQEVPVQARRSFVDPTLSDRRLEVLGESAHMAQVFGTPVADPRAARDLADGAVLASDAVLGRLLEVLPSDAVWIVLSDHGELFGEHEGLWGHNVGLYEPLVRVPLVVAGPGVGAGAVEDPVSIADLAPTVAQLTGLPPWPGSGISLLSALQGEALPSRPVRAEHFRTDYLTSGWQALDPLGDHRAVRGRRAMAVRGEVKRVVTEWGPDHGFHLDADPGERRPFAGAATGLDASLPSPRPPPADDADSGVRARLRALGYAR